MHGFLALTKKDLSRCKEVLITFTILVIITAWGARAAQMQNLLLLSAPLLMLAAISEPISSC